MSRRQGTCRSVTSSTLPGAATFVDDGLGSALFDWTPDFTESGSYQVTFFAIDDSAAVDDDRRRQGVDALVPADGELVVDHAAEVDVPGEAAEELDDAPAKTPQTKETNEQLPQDLDIFNDADNEILDDE